MNRASATAIIIGIIIAQARFSLLAAVPDMLPATTTATTTPTTAPAKLPIPDVTTQNQKRLMIFDLYKADYSKTALADRQKLAHKLVHEAAETRDDPAARFVLFNEAINMSVISGDAVPAMSACDTVILFYDVKPIEFKKQTILQLASSVTTPESATVLTLAALDLADVAAMQDLFDSVTTLANVAEGAANKTQRVSFVSSIQQRLAALRSLVQEFPGTQAAKAALEAHPDDAAAQLTIGTFYALHKGDWSTGLPHLAACNDPQLQPLAQRELAHSTDPLEQAQIGDAWWNISDAMAGVARTQIQRHAVMFYQLAKPSLAGITLARIQSRIQSVLGTPSITAIKTASTATPKNATAAAMASTLLTSAQGSGTSLLPAIDLAKDPGIGKWTRTTEGLTSDPTTRATLNLPYAPPDEYDLRITFTRLDGDGPIAAFLLAHNHAFDFALDVKGEARFERVANKIGKGNPTSVPVTIHNNHPYTLTLQVRSGTVRAFLDDKPLVEWKTDGKDLSRYVVWKLTEEKSLGLGTNSAKVVFSAIEIFDVTGTGHLTRSPE